MCHKNGVNNAISHSLSMSHITLPEKPNLEVNIVIKKGTSGNHGHYYHLHSYWQLKETMILQVGSTLTMINIQMTNKSNQEDKGN